MSNPLTSPPLTRRTFLRGLGISASLAALANLRAVPAAGALIDPVMDETLLSPRESEILTHVVERMAYTGDPEAPAARNTMAIQTIQNLLGRMDPALTADIPIALHLFEWGPILFDFTFSRFTRMTDAQKDASIRCWMTSRLGLRRLAFLAFRNLAFIGTYSQPEAWGRIGYKGPLLRPGETP